MYFDNKKRNKAQGVNRQPKDVPTEALADGPKNPLVRDFYKLSFQVHSNNVVEYYYFLELWRYVLVFMVRSTAMCVVEERNRLFFGIVRMYITCLCFIYNVPKGIKEYANIVVVTIVQTRYHCQQQFNYLVS